MRFRIHHVLFAAALAVVAVVFVSTIIGVRPGLRDDLLRSSRDELRRELELARLYLERSTGIAPDSLARTLTGRVGHRVTIVDTSGVVLGDSDVPPAELAAVENHGDRPEVRGALAGSPSFAERTSATVERPLLYGAVPAELEGRPVVLRMAASLDRIDTTLDGFQRSVVGAGVAAAVLALLLAYLLSRSLARPVAALADRARSLAGGDLSERAPRRTRLVELDELAGAFNRLAAELRTRLGELRQQRDRMGTLIESMAEGVLALTADARILRTNRAARELLELPDPAEFAPVGSVVRHPGLREFLEEAVVRRVDPREISLGERELIVQSRLVEDGGAVVTFLDVTELRRLERVRRDFVANASHELKTPLTSVRGFAESLLEEDPPPRLRRRFLTAIRDNALRLQRLVDDLLDLSRLEAGRWTVEPEPVDVASAVREAWSELSSWAASKGLEFELQGAATAAADRRSLVRALRNLLENSIQYTPGEGRISVRIEEREGRAVIEVRDDGIGIPSASLPRIFERFYRADPARSREEGGTGLGLAIVKHLVDTMGGEVEAESRLGRGTTIRVRLPGADRG